MYVILQIAGLGYLTGGSTLVSDAAACRSARGKLNFCSQCYKSVVEFDSIQTNSVGGYKGIHLKLDNT